MIIFNLDAKPQSDDLRVCNDYSARIIKNAIAIPLIKINSINGLIEGGLCNLSTSKTKKTILYVNEFYFSNGQKLLPLHIKNHITWIIKKSTKYKFMLEDLKKIKTKKNMIIFYHRKNINFKFLLTDINFSPFLNKDISCGNFCIRDIKLNYLIVESNKYNNKHKKTIMFNFIYNNYEDVKMFEEGTTDFTNPTTFPVELINNSRNSLHIHENNILLSISFMNRKLLNNEYLNLRKMIFYSINRELITSKFNPMLTPIYNFKDKEKTKIDNSAITKNESNIKLVMGYDNFYPNKEISLIIKEMLEKNNIKIELIETNFYNRDETVDLQLNLTYRDYNHKSFYYLSKYFELLTKLSSPFDYKKIQKLKYKYLKKGDDQSFDQLTKTIDKLYVEIPLFIENAIFLSKYNNFNFNSFNFQDL